MTTVDGMKISKGLVLSLKNMSGSFSSTRLDDYIDSLMVANDYLIDKLTEEDTTNVSEITRISAMLVEMKAIRDSLSELNTNLKECLPNEEKS